MGQLTTTFTRAYGISCGGVTRCTPAAPTASALKWCSASWEYCNSAVFRWNPVRESAVKPVGKPDALIGHVRFDERGWETGRRSGVSARAHPRLYKVSAQGFRLVKVHRVPYAKKDVQFRPSATE